MEAIKIDKTGSVLIDTKKGFNVWVDVYKDGDELTADWNKYIFYLDNENDVKIKNFQEDCNNFIEASEVAIDFYERQIFITAHNAIDDCKYQIGYCSDIWRSLNCH